MSPHGAFEQLLPPHIQCGQHILAMYPVLHTATGTQLYSHSVTTTGEVNVTSVGRWTLDTGGRYPRVDDTVKLTCDGDHLSYHVSCTGIYQVVILWSDEPSDFHRSWSCFERVVIHQFVNHSWGIKTRICDDGSNLVKLCHIGQDSLYLFDNMSRTHMWHLSTTTGSSIDSSDDVMSDGPSSNLNVTEMLNKRLYLMHMIIICQLLL